MKRASAVGIPAVQALCQRIELDGRLVSIYALNMQTGVAREIVLEHRDDYLLTVKGNQSAVQAQVADPDVPYSPG